MNNVDMKQRRFHTEYAQIDSPGRSTMGEVIMYMNAMWHVCNLPSYFPGSPKIKPLDLLSTPF